MHTTSGDFLPSIACLAWATFEHPCIGSEQLNQVAWQEDSSINRYIRNLRRNVPLSHPKVLRYLFERFSTFLIPNGLIDMGKEPFGHVTSCLNGFIFLSDFGILQDLINIGGQFSLYFYTRQRIPQTCFTSKGYLVILCTRSRNTINFRDLREWVKHSLGASK